MIEVFEDLLSVLTTQRRLHCNAVGLKVASQAHLVAPHLRGDLIMAGILHDIGYGHSLAGSMPLTARIAWLSRDFLKSFAIWSSTIQLVLWRRRNGALISQLSTNTRSPQPPPRRHLPGRAGGPRRRDPGPRAADPLTAAYAAHPERFVRKPPEPPEIPSAAWINPPTETQEATQ